MSYEIRVPIWEKDDWNRFCFGEYSIRPIRNGFEASKDCPHESVVLGTRDTLDKAKKLCEDDRLEGLMEQLVEIKTTPSTTIPTEDGLYWFRNSTYDTWIHVAVMLDGTVFYIGAEGVRRTRALAETSLVGEWIKIEKPNG